MCRDLSRREIDGKFFFLSPCFGRTVGKTIFSHSKKIEHPSDCIMRNYDKLVPISTACCRCESLLVANTRRAPIFSVSPLARSDRGQQRHFSSKTSSPNAIQQTGVSFPECTSPAQPADPGVGTCQSSLQLAVQLLDTDWRM